MKKKDGGYQLCVDYNTLDALTIKDKFSIPTIDEIMGELKGSNVLSKLDLRSCLHQIKIHPYDVQKIAFKTHEEHFEFLVMPFDLTNAPSTL